MARRGRFVRRLSSLLWKYGKQVYCNDVQNYEIYNIRKIKSHSKVREIIYKILHFVKNCTKKMKCYNKIKA